MGVPEREIIFGTLRERRSHTVRDPRTLSSAASLVAALLCLAPALPADHARAAAPLPPIVVDGADLAIFPGMIAPLRFRLQNTTAEDIVLSWTIAGGTGQPELVTVPALKDAMVEMMSSMLTEIGERTFTILLRDVATAAAYKASLVVDVADPARLPAVQTVEEEVVVDQPLQKPIVIVTAAEPKAPPPPFEGWEKESSPAGSAASAMSVHCFATVMNPDPTHADRILVVSPTSWTVSAPPGAPVTTSVTISLPPGGLPFGTMNTVVVHVEVPGDTVIASGQVIYQGTCTGSETQCPPWSVPSLWHVSTYDAYGSPLEETSLWCGQLDPAGWNAEPGYGSCWDASVYLRLGTQATFSAAAGMTLGGVQLFSSEKAHDLCTIEIGAGDGPEAISTWREVARFSGISNPDSAGCVSWPASPHLCARYEPFDVIVPAADVPANESLPLFVRWRFRSDLTWDDQGTMPGADTRGAWRIDHVSVRGDLPSSQFPPDPARALVETFEGGAPPQWEFVPSRIGNCAAGGAVDIGTPDGLEGLLGETGPRILSAVPNPARSTLTLRVFVPAAGPARLAIFDPQGRRVRDLGLGILGAGVHDVSWDGAARNGKPVTSGIYLVRLEAGGGSDVSRVMFLRR